MGLFKKNKKESDSASTMEEGGNVSGNVMPLYETTKIEGTHEEEKRVKNAEEIPLTETKSTKKSPKKEEHSEPKSKLSRKASSDSTKSRRADTAIDMDRRETKEKGTWEERADEEERPKPDTKEKQLLRKIDHVKTIMDDNIQKSLDRGEKMEEIGAQAGK